MAAYEENMNPWPVIRWLLTASCIHRSNCDPAGLPLRYSLVDSLTRDPNGYWHELFYILVGWGVSIDLTYRWEKTEKVYRIRRKIKEEER